MVGEYNAFTNRPVVPYPQFADPEDLRTKSKSFGGKNQS